MLTFIAILLMILGHCSIVYAKCPLLRDCIYSFHIPLFFLISGYFLKKTNIQYAIGKLANSCLRPYYITMVLAAIFVSLTIYMVEHVFHTWIIKEFIERMFWGSAYFIPGIKFGMVPRGGAIWFLYALFWASSMCIYIQRFSFKKRVILVGLIFFISYIIIQFVRLPFGLCQGGVALAYVAIGSEVREHDILAELMEKIWYVLLSLPIWLLCVYYGGISMGECYFGVHPLLMFVGSIAGCYIFCFLCFTFLNYKCRWGQYTLYVLCGHSLVQFILLYDDFFHITLNIYEELVFKFAVSFLFAIPLFYIISYTDIFKRCEKLAQNRDK